MSHELLIEPEVLHELLAQTEVRIFDATVYLTVGQGGYKVTSGHSTYQEGHIPGAAFMDLTQTFADTTSGLGFTLPSIDALRQAASEAGIDPTKPVITYSKGHTMWATRAFWLLRYLGIPNVRVLNGGFAAWQAAGLPEESGDAIYPPCACDTESNLTVFADIVEVENATTNTATHGVCTINALSQEMYEGSGEVNYGRPGHIPGSKHLFYDEILENGKFRDLTTIQHALEARGMLSAERVITYCGGGIAATVDALACLLAGQENVAVYDGSMSEWVREGKPLTTGTEP